jgi:hypothetical protein
MDNTRTRSWTERLDECQRETEPPLSRVAWLRRVYARIYRFLIARYGDRRPAEPASSSMPFGDCSTPLDGKAARSPGELQTALKHIQAAQPAPLFVVKEDKPAPTWITVFEHSERVNFHACHKLLRAHGLEVRVLRQGAHRLLQVPLADRNVAFALLAAHRDELRVPREVVAERRQIIQQLLGLVCGGVAFAIGALCMGALMHNSRGEWYALVASAGTLAVLLGIVFAWGIRRRVIY